MYLNDLKFIDGSMKNRKRVARGKSGKSSGRGQKGQKSRSGVSLSNFQGGQTPIERRIPKHRVSFTRKTMMELPLHKLNALYDSKLVDNDIILSRDILEKFKLIKKNYRYKVIGNTNKCVKIKADAFSAGAEKSIKHNGGIVLIVGEDTKIDESR